MILNCSSDFTVDALTRQPGPTASFILYFGINRKRQEKAVNER